MGVLTGPGLGKFECSDLATCSLSELGTADAGDIASGTFDSDRIPILPISRYGSAVLVSGTRLMEGTFNVGNHPIDDVSKIGFRDIHDVALITEGTYELSLVSKDESIWANLSSGWIYPYTGIHWTISAKQAGENLSGSDLVYLKSDDKWWKTDADAEATTKGLLGLAMQTKTAGQTVRVLLFGRVTSAGWSWTVGAPIYVSCTTGALTQTAPSVSGDQVRKIGHALSSDTLIFNPDATIIELS